jgi:hypothetical protein
MRAAWPGRTIAAMRTHAAALSLATVVQIPSRRLERADDRLGPDFLTTSPDVLVETRPPGRTAHPRRGRPALAF